MMLHRLASAAAFVLLLASAGAASAAEWVPKAMGSRIVSEVDWWPYYWEHVVAMGIAAQGQVDNVVFLDLDMAVALTTPGPEAKPRIETEFAFGNPTVGVHWANRLSTKLAMHAGGTVSVPTLVNRPHEGPDYTRGTRNAGAATRALADLHRFYNDYIFLRVRTGVELQLLPELYYRAEVVPMIAIPIAKDRDHVDYLVDVHNEIEARHSTGIGGGLHFQANFTTNQDENERYSDTMQLAMEPYLFYDAGRGLYARLGSLVALDAPLGLGFERGGMASIRMTLGARW